MADCNKVSGVGLLVLGCLLVFQGVGLGLNRVRGTFRSESQAHLAGEA